MRAMFRYRMARRCWESSRSTTLRRPSTKSRASKTACSEAISRARRKNDGLTARQRGLVAAQYKDRRPALENGALALAPGGDRAAHDFLARQAKIDRHAQSRFGTAGCQRRVEERLVAVRGFDKELR